VGKSSLVARYVESIFSDTYHTTIGVKIETRTVRRPLGTVDLVLWDISGEDEFQTVQASYLRGARGYMLVVDGTRRQTLDVAIMLEARVRSVVSFVPSVAVLNKADLVGEWEIGSRDLETIRAREWDVVKSSAKTGAGVEEAFNRLADRVLHPGGSL
jgi:small GTP-binding protein